MALFCTACNEEWTDEQYEHYVSFKAPMDYARGVTDIYVKYKLNGAVTYQLPVIMSGSTLPGHDTEVQIAIDSDTLKVSIGSIFTIGQIYIIRSLPPIIMRWRT